jgi:hypothetical protein
MCRQLPGERDYRQMRVRLDFEEKSDCAHDQAVHHESGCEGGEFGREGVHVGGFGVECQSVHGAGGFGS